MKFFCFTNDHSSRTKNENSSCTTSTNRLHFWGKPPFTSTSISTGTNTRTTSTGSTGARNTCILFKAYFCVSVKSEGKIYDKKRMCYKFERYYLCRFQDIELSVRRDIIGINHSRVNLKSTIQCASEVSNHLLRWHEVSPFASQFLIKQQLSMTISTTYPHILITERGEVCFVFE